MLMIARGKLVDKHAVTEPGKKFMELEGSQSDESLANTSPPR
jgi:hypothetical protein